MIGGCPTPRRCCVCSTTPLSGCPSTPAPCSARRRTSRTAGSRRVDVVRLRPGPGGPRGGGPGRRARPVLRHGHAGPLGPHRAGAQPLLLLRRAQRASTPRPSCSPGRREWSTTRSPTGASGLDEVLDELGRGAEPEVLKPLALEVSIDRPGADGDGSRRVPSWQVRAMQPTVRITPVTTGRKGTWIKRGIGWDERRARRTPQSRPGSSWPRSPSSRRRVARRTTTGARPRSTTSDRVSGRCWPALGRQASS